MPKVQDGDDEAGCEALIRSTVVVNANRNKGGVVCNAEASLVTPKSHSTLCPMCMWVMRRLVVMTVAVMATQMTRMAGRGDDTGAAGGDSGDACDADMMVMAVPL